MKSTRSTKRFGGLAAVNDVSVTLRSAAQINAIIGPNGAGKTTFFNLISGAHRADLGPHHASTASDVTGLRADQVARLGMARTFQTTTLFDTATVLDNLIVGHRLRTRSGLLDVLLEHAPAAGGRAHLPRQGARGAGLRGPGARGEPHRRRHLAGRTQARRLRAGPGDRSDHCCCWTSRPAA